MAERKIDFDRGVIFATHPSLGISVYMYVDKPGHYLNVHGKEIPEQLARECGLDVEKYGKDRRRREMIAKATKAVDDELKEISEDVKELVKEVRGKFKLVDIGYGRFNVRDEEDNVLNATPLSEELANKLIDRLNGE